ncbi:hypothetical protein HIJ39_22615 [Sulfobacillus sp. DSM 109850]|uniref:Uncharacterized protein n=1 Tax=Sulfobacillus harzensis TaxID=2729629 RepID=A0A7Y0L9T5_9FIRM|nr:hypothetical protein [Sulfobacillus harzensis]
MKNCLHKILDTPFVLGVGLVSGLGIVAGHVLHQENITGDLAVGGLWGWVLFITSTIKVSDWDIYGASLALVNGLDLLNIKSLSRTEMAVIVGCLGTVAGMLGIINHFVPLLTLMGVAIPPVAAIVTIQYFMFQPSERSMVALVAAWGIGFGCGEWIHWGIPALNSLVVSGLVYWAVFPVSRRQHWFHKFDGGMKGRTRP